MPIKRVQRGRNHSYLINDAKVMGVTTALSEGVPKPNLVGWAARVVAETAADLTPQEYHQIRSQGRDNMVNHLRRAHIQQRNIAAVRGTRVHRAAELLQAGELVTVEDDIVGHVEQCARFLDQWKIRPLLVERPVGSYAWGYAGTFDLIAELPAGDRILFDYKTAASGIFPETAMQLAAYRYADAYVADDAFKTEVPMREVGITGCKAVWVRADGYDVIPLVADKATHKAFLHALSVARFRTVMTEWVGASEPPPS